ncbi:MAG: hypothetical protein M3O46_05755 [Myxococcota bacterium]|nr:hypothetical protein [Myxococcota bacterium]
MSKVPLAEQLELFGPPHEGVAEQQESARCDACGQPFDDDDDDDVGYRLPGTGVYLWKRGDNICLEKVPLCASCASAIGMNALARWEIEEEEG